VFFMGMSEVLRSIKSAEQGAEKRLAEAQEEATKIVSDARRKSSEMVQNAADETVAMTAADPRRRPIQRPRRSRPSKGCRRQGIATIEANSATTKTKPSKWSLTHYPS
jgi:cell division septum initiation protein DivIVA